MNVKSLIAPSLSILLLAGCARLMGDSKLSYSDLPLMENEQKTFCTHQGKTPTLTSPHQSGTEIFLDLLPQMRRQLVLSAIDEFVLWSLYQFNLNPFMATPTARFQAMIKIKDQWTYWDVSESLNSLPEQAVPTPYLYALDKILQHYKSEHRLLSLARILDRTLPQSIPISRSTALLINQYASELKENSELEPIFFKAGQSLRPEETIARLSYVKLISALNASIKKKDYYHLQSHLFDYQEARARCNFDPSIYDHGVYLVALEQNEGSNPFSMISGHGSQFLAVSGQWPNLGKALNGTYLFGPAKLPAPYSFCLIQAQENEIALMSTEGRDTGQILHQYLTPLLNERADPLRLDEYLRSSRYVKLYNPDRLVYESHRPALQQRPEGKFSLYHAKAIGNVWGIHQRNKQLSSFIDIRREGFLTCQNQ